MKSIKKRLEQWAKHSFAVDEPATKKKNKTNRMTMETDIIPDNSN